MSEHYKVIGMMSGTSLDGLDICLAELTHDAQGWKYGISNAETIPYSHQWKTRLTFDPGISKQELKDLDHEYGNWLGAQVKEFMSSYRLKDVDVDLISSHGHTIFHQPEAGYTKQIGCGPEIFNITGITTVTDFRVQDVSLGGQGAPLVPIGDQLLFGDYDACLNLGGFANVSLSSQNNVLAFDICPVNFVLNLFAAQLNLDYDENGEIARKTSLNRSLLDELSALDFYSEEPPKSLGAEWVNQIFLPLVHQYDLKAEELLATCTEHAAVQIAGILQNYGVNECLVTGGGAFNSFLMTRISALSGVSIVKPDVQVVNYKEALIFALLGVLKFRGEINVMSSVTGASRDHSSGLIYNM